MWEAGASESSTCCRTTGAPSARSTAPRSGWSAATEGGPMAYALDPAELHRRWQAAAAVSVRRTERAVEQVDAAEAHRDQAQRVRNIAPPRPADTAARSPLRCRTAASGVHVQHS